MLLVLDTNVLSELMRAVPDAQVLNWFDRHTNATFATTAICQAEILAGLSLLPNGKRKRQFLAAADALWNEDLGGRIFPFDSAAAVVLADIVQTRQAKGQPIQFADAAIAAICRRHKAAVVTRDEGGFAGTSVKLINPWAD
ncbi:MAG: type II toxin-antitoxin system VapC family toxin [Pseudomonadota bacterium]|nr:type II toxin-antitoxin system VapC family toxin [Pseudomonadota bacterium]